MIGATIAVIIALFIRAFFFQPFNVPSASMTPALKVGDYFLASKSGARDRNPQRGDIIVFYTAAKSSYFVKRVVGLPGDRVQMRDGRLFLNGAAIPTVAVADYVETCGAGLCRIPRFVETFPGGATDEVLDRDPDGALDETGIYVVPRDSYFVLGDDRDNSDDSRADVGFVPRDDIVGRAALKFKSGGHLTLAMVR